MILPTSPTSVPEPSQVFKLGQGSPPPTKATRRGGRPRQSWPVKMTRMLVRLYVYTTLPLDEIMDLIRHRFFQDSMPSRRSAQVLLRSLLDECTQKPRLLRPRTRKDMERRVTMLKERFKDGHIAHERVVLQRQRSVTLTGTLQKIETESTPGPFLDTNASFSQIEPLELIQKRQRRMSLDWSTDSSTKGYNSVLSSYSDEFRRAVKHIQKDYDAGLVNTDERLDITTNDTIGDFISQTVVSNALEEYSTMPSSFLRADVHRQRDGTCMEGIDAHDRNICLCSISENRLAEFWVLPHGVSARGQQIIETGEISESDISFRDTFGNSVLHFIAARASQATLFTALKARADVSVKNSGGQTFLHTLKPSWFSNLESTTSSLRVLLTSLLSRPMDIYARDAYGRNIFHYIKSYVGDTMVVQQIAADYDLHRICLRDASGIIPIEPPEIQILGTNEDDHISLDIDQVNTLPPTEQVTADTRHILRKSRLLKIVNLALTNPMTESKEGQNGLHCLAELLLNPDESLLRKRLGILQSLVDVGVSVNAYDGSGDTVLMAFVKNIPEEDVFKDTWEILETLIRRGGADVNARNRHGETALSIAIKTNRKLVLPTIALIHNGANIHARDWHARGVLSILAERSTTWTRLGEVGQYARSEACFAVLSGNGAILSPTSLNEWGERELETITGNKVRKERGFSSSSTSKGLLYTAPFHSIDDPEDEDYNTEKPGQAYLTSPLNKVEQSVSENIDFKIVATSDEVYDKTDLTTDNPRIKSCSATPSVSSTQEPIASMDDVCNRILFENFAVTLDEIPDPGDAWESVRQCLDELTHIIGREPSYMTPVGISIGAPGMNVAASGDSSPPSNANSYQHCQEKRQKKGKEKEKSSGDGDESDLENTGSKSQDCGPTNESKRSKVIRNLNCPFRKRNSLRFNVRDYHNCAITKFPDITLVKRHVITYHKRKNLPIETHLCSRCHAKFSSPHERDVHLRVETDRICPMRELAEVADDDDEIDPEDGITPVVEGRLRDRRTNNQILQWGILWMALFPLDIDIPSADYEEVIEHHEIRRLFQDHSDRCRLMVQSKVESMLSSMSHTCEVDYTQEMWDLFQSFLHYIFERCDQIMFTTVTKTAQKRKHHPEPRSIQPSSESSNSISNRPTTRRRIMPHPPGSSGFTQSQQPSPSSTSTILPSNAPGFSGHQTPASSTQVSFPESMRLTGLQDHEPRTEARDTFENEALELSICIFCDKESCLCHLNLCPFCDKEPCSCFVEGF